MNRTGIQTSPNETKKLLEAERVLGSQFEGDPAEFVDVKVQSISEADPLGSVPPPASVKGIAKAGMKMITGAKPQVFIDKLAERAAFERGGTRLYDALIVKFQTTGDTASGARLEDLTKIRSDELAHFHLLTEAVRSLGGDPTVQTPSAAIVGVETTGLMQVLNDPRTTFTDCLNAMLVAELTDVDGWNLLATLAEGIGEDELAARFRDALLEENHHLQMVRGWYQKCVMGEGGAR
jgi:bacterioferritin (cytochrome b1)